MPTQSSSDLEEGELPRKEPPPPPPTQPRYCSTPIAPRSTQLVAPPPCLPHRPQASAVSTAVHRPSSTPNHRLPSSTLPAKPAIGPPLPPQQEQFHRFCAATQQQRGWDPPAGQNDKEIRRREHDAWHRRDYHDLDEEDHYFMARDGRPPLRFNDDRPPLRVNHDDFAAPPLADWHSPPPRRIKDDLPPYRNDDNFATPPPAGWHLPLSPRNGNHFDPSRPLPPHMSNRKTPAELAAIAEHYEARKQERIALAHQKQIRRDRDLEDALRQRSRDELGISRPSSSSGPKKRPHAPAAKEEHDKNAITTLDLQRRLELLEKELAETKAQAAASAAVQAAAAQVSGSSNAPPQVSGSKDVDANVTIQASSKEAEPNAAHASGKSHDHDRPRSKRRRKSSRTPSPAPTHRSGTMGMKRSEAEREERGPRTRGEESRAQRRRGDSGEAEDEGRPGTSGCKGERPKERRSRDGGHHHADKRRSKDHRDDDSRPSSRRDHDRERARPVDKYRPTSRKSHRSKDDVRDHSPRPRSRRDEEAGEEEHRTKDQRRLEDRQRHEEHQRKARALLERGPSRGSARTSHRRSKPAVEQRRSPEPQPEPQASAEDKQPRTRQPSAYQCEKWFVEDPAAQAEFQGRDYGNLPPAPLPACLPLDESVLRPLPPQDEVELDYGSATPAQSQTQEQVKHTAAKEPVSAAKSQGQDLNATSPTATSPDLNSLRLAALSTLKRKRSHETEASTHSTRRDSSDSASSNDTPSTANSSNTSLASASASNTSLDTQVTPPADEGASSRILPPPGCLYLRPTTAGAATPFTTTCALPPAPLTAPLPPTSSPSLRLMHPIVFPVTTSAPYWMASPAPMPTPQPFWIPPTPYQPQAPISRRATDPSPFYSRSSLSQANQPPCIIEDVDALSDDDEDGTHRDVAEELSKIKARHADSTAACVGMEAQLALMKSQIQVKEASRGVRGGQDHAHEGVVAAGASASATATSQ